MKLVVHNPFYRVNCRIIGGARAPSAPTGLAPLGNKVIKSIYWRYQWLITHELNQLYPGEVIIVAITFRQKMHLETVQGKTNLFWLSRRFMKYPHVGHQTSWFFTRILMELFNFRNFFKFHSDITQKKGWPTKMLSHISVTSEWLKICFCSFRKSPFSKK